MTGEDVLKKAVTTAQGETNPNEVIEVGMIIGLVTAIFDIIKQCRNKDGGDAAASHIQRGSAMAEGHMRRMLRREGYEGNVRTMASKLVAQGTKATPEEIRAVIEEAQDSPVPPGIWPAVGAVLMGFCLFAGSAAANDTFPSEPAAGLWPQLSEDVSAIKSTVEDLDKRTGNIERDLAKLINVLEGGEQPTPVPAIAPKPVAAASSGITYRGQPINVDDFLARNNPRHSKEPGINGSVVAHLQAHQFGGNLNSISREQQLQLHSAAHRMGQGATATVSRSMPVAPAAVGCANGQCAISGQRQFKRYGLFGRPIFK